MNEEELNLLAERMGEAVHNKWMEKRRKEKGWHNPEECPAGKHEGAWLYSYGYCPLCHSCMRPYKDLPEGEKELDRQYPDLFFRILEEMGYQVIKRRENE